MFRRFVLLTLCCCYARIARSFNVGAINSPLQRHSVVDERRREIRNRFVRGSQRSGLPVLPRTFAVPPSANEEKPPSRLAELASSLKTFLLSTWIGGLTCGLTASSVVFFAVDGYRVLESQETREASEQFEAVLDLLERAYVERVEPRDILKASLEASLNKLDPYTEFEEKRDAEALQTQYDGRYAGVGMVIGKRGDDVIIVDAFEGYSYEAGLRSGDRLISVDGVNTADQSLEDVKNMLRGKPDTQVTVEYRHLWEPTATTVELTRSDVREPDLRVATRIPLSPSSSLRGGQEDGIAYARISLFSRETAASLQQALKLLPSDNVILDLRGNPGGLLEAAVQVASIFVPPGADIASATSPKVYESATFRSSPSNTAGEHDANGPSRRLVILVDGGTASASEIVAAAIQDNDVGVIVGERTFGKGLVQSVIDLPYGAKLKLTVGQYKTPSGRSLQEIDYPTGTKRKKEEFKTLVRGRPVQSGAGVTPDVVVAAQPLSTTDAFLLKSGILENYIDSWLAKKPEVAAKLYDASQAASLEGYLIPPKKIFTPADVLDLERFVLDTVRDDASKSSDSSDVDEEERKREEKKLLDDLTGTFRAKPTSIAKLADSSVRTRFFRSSANVRRLLADDGDDADRQFAAARALLQDPTKYDALLQSP